MSQEINNRAYRSEVIRRLLSQLHEGRSVDEVKAEFERAFDGVSAAEISEAEQALIAGGMEVREVQRLCDVHAAVFRDKLSGEAAGAAGGGPDTPGHPAHTLRAENRALERLIDARIRPALSALTAGEAGALREALGALSGIDAHYARKENLLFPYLERHGVTAPPKVMWGVDDEIRALIRQARSLASAEPVEPVELAQVVEAVLDRVSEMIFKEDNILLPMLAEHLTEDEWRKVAEESEGIGYFLIPTPPAWKPSAAGAADGREGAWPEGDVVLPTGALRLSELNALLNALPVDITFVGADDTVKYFSEGAERVFPRTKAVIGRKVVNCHPPASVHIVEGIVNDLKSGKKTHEDFWIRMGDRYVYIRYFAVRDTGGKYLGTLEVTQNIAPIMQITGEKRLVSD
ncbi:MAG: DUF438 domain-containing protein [Christensenellaceae bacterium]|nr:DUF438 domain-containing protein [Christensenellaceae bacterium]